MKRAYFIPLLIILSVLQAGTVINFGTLNALLIRDDHPKFFSYSVENARLLLEYGTPFGFNHDFQGGIPTFYLRSCFLELTPFLLLFGEQLGYQIMLVFFLVLIPISFYYLVRQWTDNEELARIAAFLVSFYTGGDFLKYGTTPVVVGYSLTFLILLFFSRYLSSVKTYLLPLILSAAMLAHTHLIFFAVTCVVCGVVAVVHARFHPVARIVRRTAFFAAILAGVLSDLGYQLYLYWDYLRLDYASGVFSNRKAPWDEFIYNFRELLIGFSSTGSHLLIATVVLGICYRRVTDQVQRRMIRIALIVSALFIMMLLFNKVMTYDIFIWRISNFAPYAFMFDLALILSIPLWKHWRAVSLLVTVIVMFWAYPCSNKFLPTVNSTGDIDPALGRFLGKGDFVLLENRAHLSSMYGIGDFKTYPDSHWETYLRNELDVRMMGHMGEDAQPYNALRQMYVVNGCYLGKALDSQSGAQLAMLMKQWGVGKACVWSPEAITFFKENPSFVSLGTSKYYTCFRGTYPPVPDVLTRDTVMGELHDVTPFSFRVKISGATGCEKVIVNKNYFPFWSARDQNGMPVALKKDGQRISLETCSNGDIFFEFRKIPLLGVGALTALFLAAVADVLVFLGIRGTGSN